MSVTDTCCELAWWSFSFEQLLVPLIWACRYQSVICSEVM